MRLSAACSETVERTTPRRPRSVQTKGSLPIRQALDTQAIGGTARFAADKYLHTMEDTTMNTIEHDDELIDRR